MRAKRAAAGLGAQAARELNAPPRALAVSPAHGYRSRDMDDLIAPDEIAFRLELTAAQLKIVHTALKSLFDDLGHEEHDVKQVVSAVLAKLPGEHEIRAIDLERELRGASRGRRRPEPRLRTRARTWRLRSSARASTAARTSSSGWTSSTPSSSHTNSSICSETCGPIGQPGLVSV